VTALWTVVGIVAGAALYYAVGVGLTYLVQTRYRRPYDHGDWDSLILIWPLVLPQIVREERAYRAVRRAAKREGDRSAP